MFATSVLQPAGGPASYRPSISAALTRPSLFNQNSVGMVAIAITTPHQ